MSSKTGKRGFAVGREVGRGGTLHAFGGNKREE